MLTLRVKLWYPDAQRPTKTYNTDSGYDAYLYLGSRRADGGIIIPPGQHVSISFGIALEIPSGFEVQARPRSSTQPKGLLAHWGTVDESFRGEMFGVYTNLSAEYLVVQHGDRLHQLVLVPRLTWCMEEVTELTPSERGARGWGSSGR